MPLLIAFPLLPFTIIMLVFGYFIVGGAFIYTADSISFGGLQNTFGQMGNASSAVAGSLANAAGVNTTALAEEAAALQAAAQAELAAQAAAK
jgi:hypothetical protein